MKKNLQPTQVGRADTLNARTLQYLIMTGFFTQLYPLGKACNTSSIWHDGKFISRQSTWWQNLAGCMHKHFLMIGQAHSEKLINDKLHELHASVQRGMTLLDIAIHDDHCLLYLDNHKVLKARFVIAAEGPHSLI